MRIYASQNESLLFDKVDWHSVLEHHRKQMVANIGYISSNRLLNTSVGDLTEYLLEIYMLDVPVLDKKGICVHQHESKIDVSQDSDRDIVDRGRPFYISGTSVVITVPFRGDHSMFDVRLTPYSLSSQRAEVNDDHFTLTITGTDLEPEELRAEIDSRLADINTNLGQQRAEAVGFNEKLRTQADHHIRRRREKLLADQNLVAGLGFPLKQRPDSLTTYKAPEVRRRIKRAMPVATTKPYKPEPVLDTTDYEHILSVMTNMANVMELTPSAFKSMGEGDLRTHFLVQLNGHYEGQATSETFNYEGKTDILIRTEGRNIFIAECKYWGGSKKLTETIDQLLGYTSWRDTKTAIVIFNRRKNFTRVLEVIPQTIAAHANFKRALDPVSDSEFRYIFAHRDDPNRELTLTVQAFDVPAKGVPAAN